MSTFLVKFSTSRTGDTFGVLVSAVQSEAAKIKAELKARNRKLFYHFVEGVCKVDDDWRDK